MPDIVEQTDKILSLFSRRAKKQFSIVLTNFRIGRLVHEISQQYGPEGVKEIAKELSAKGARTSEAFLYDTARVFRTIGNEDLLRKINAKLRGNLNWWFLLNECTKAPEGDNEEAFLYWEREMSRIEQSLEKAFEKLDQLSLLKESLLDNIKEQAEGLLCIERKDQKEEGHYKFAHIGDIHIYEQFSLAGRMLIDPTTGKNLRLLDIHKCLTFATDKIIDAGCHACFIPGDLTETHSPTPNEQGFLQYNLLRISERMPVFVEPGNHGLSKNPKDASSLEFLKGRPNIIVVEKPSIFYQEGVSVNEKPSEHWGRGLCAKIFILPFPSRVLSNREDEKLSIAELNKAASEKLRAVLEYFRGKLDPGVPNILLAHITIAGAKGAENPAILAYDPVLYPEDLRGFDYVALNHIHHHQQVSENAYYAGSIERTDFSDEDIPKGFLIVTMRGKNPEAEFIETPARSFSTLTPDFFRSDNWKSLVDPETVYRIKGEVAKENYQEIVPFIRAFPVPLLNKLTVKREVRVRDEQMTGELKEEDALSRFLASLEITEDILMMCLETHSSILEDKQDKERSNKIEARPLIASELSVIPER